MQSLTYPNSAEPHSACLWLLLLNLVLAHGLGTVSPLEFFLVGLLLIKMAILCKKTEWPVDQS